MSEITSFLLGPSWLAVQSFMAVQLWLKYVNLVQNGGVTGPKNADYWQTDKWMSSLNGPFSQFSHN